MIRKPLQARGYASTPLARRLLQEGTDGPRFPVASLFDVAHRPPRRCRHASAGARLIPARGSLDHLLTEMVKLS